MYFLTRIEEPYLFSYIKKKILNIFNASLPWIF